MSGDPIGDMARRMLKENTMTRPDWDLYFIRIAMEVASRSTCPRAAVGAEPISDKSPERITFEKMATGIFSILLYFKPFAYFTDN